MRHVPSLLLLIAALAGAACQPAAERSVPAAVAPEADAPPPIAKRPPELEPTPAMLEVLARADSVDGTADHVVSRCPGCSLAMSGSSASALDVGGYALHFCSDSCLDHFREQPQAGMDALAEAVPEAEPETGG